MYPALRKGEGREERASDHGSMYHVCQRCLSRTATHLMLPCHPQMSGTGSGPSADTMKKWSKKQRQTWQSNENRRTQRELTARAAEGANLASSAHKPGAPHSDFFLAVPQQLSAAGVLTVGPVEMGGVCKVHASFTPLPEGDSQ